MCYSIQSLVVFYLKLCTDSEVLNVFWNTEKTFECECFMKSYLIFVKKKNVIPATCTDFTFLASISKKT